MSQNKQSSETLKYPSITKQYTFDAGTHLCCSQNLYVAHAWGCSLRGCWLAVVKVMAEQLGDIRLQTSVNVRCFFCKFIERSSPQTHSTVAESFLYIHNNEAFIGYKINTSLSAGGHVNMFSFFPKNKLQNIIKNFNLILLSNLI